MTILKNRSLLLPATEEDRRGRRTEKEEEEEGRRRNQLTALKRVVSVFSVVTGVLISLSNSLASFIEAVMLSPNS